LVGAAADGKLGWTEIAEGEDGGGGELSEPFRDAWAAGPLAVFIPPAIFAEKQAVLNLPRGAHRSQEFARGDTIWIAAWC